MRRSGVGEGGGTNRSRRRRLLAQLRDQSGDRVHDPVRCRRPASSAVTGWSRRSSRFTGSPTSIRSVLRGSSLGKWICGPYISSWAPHCPIGTTGHPVRRAIRAAPVLPAIGHRSGSRVIVPFRVDHHRPALVHAPSTAAGSASADLADCRCTGIWPQARRMRPTTGTPNREALARNRGQRPEKAEKLAERDRVGVGDVVDHEDHAAGLRDLVLASPVPPGQRADDGVEQRDDRRRSCPVPAPG